MEELNKKLAEEQASKIIDEWMNENKEQIEQSFKDLVMFGYSQIKIE